MFISRHFLIKISFLFSGLLSVIWLQQLLIARAPREPYILPSLREYYLAKQNNELSNVTLCPITPPNLAMNVTIDFDKFKKTYTELNAAETFGNKSAYFQPDHCLSRFRLAIIIPFRDRESHLSILLGHLHPFLARQLSSFQIFVVHQSGEETFNKGRLMNTGFRFAQKVGEENNRPFDCFIFHDVDMLPESDLNTYRCDVSRVYHLACSIDKFKYKPMCCGVTVGGVLSFTEQQYERVNGFPNNYWGWGGEDDDVNVRIKYHKIPIERPPIQLCRYTMIKHERDVRNTYNAKAVYQRMHSARLRLKTNGLSNLDTKVIGVEYHSLYVNVSTYVGLNN